MKVAVVGSGIDGASAARQLAERGHETVLFEQFNLGHTRGSSHGNSRIVRRAYPDALYTEIMMDAYPMWAHLQANSGVDILHETGLLYFGSKESPQVESVINSLECLEVEHRVLNCTQVKSVFAQLLIEPDEIGVWTPEAGWVHAANAVRATLDLAKRSGLEIRENTKVDQSMLESEFDAFVVCPGAWITDWVKVPVRVTLQTYGYIQAHVHGPVWIEDSAENPYGFPSEDGLGMKIGIHEPGPQIDPRDPHRLPSAKAIQQIEETARKRFGIKAPHVENSVGCLYTSTDDEDFLLGHLGKKGFFASACSGHGFKFGPWIGKVLADFVERRDEPERYFRFFFEPR